MRNVGLDKLQARIKIGGRKINNFRYVDDTTLMSESDKGLKNLLMRVKESERAGLRLNIKKKKKKTQTKIMALAPFSSVQSLSRIRLLVTP